MMSKEGPMKPDLLMMGKLMPHVMEALERAYQAHRYWEAPDKAALLSEVGPRIRGVATTGSIGLRTAAMAALPKLEIVSVYGVGLDAVDLAQAKARGIHVTTTPDVLTADVADMGVALLLAVSRRIVAYDAYVRAGEWPKKGEPPLTRKASGKRAGILGMGRVGRALAKRLAALDMGIAYFDVAQDPSLPYRAVGSLRELAASSDYLIITAAGGEATRKLVNSEIFALMPEDSFLINVSRGSIVDEEALVAALQQGQIAGAGLDVFYSEPNPHPALLEMPNVVLQPHMASGTLETRRAMGDLVIDNLAAHFAGQPLLTPV
jgi:D-3-phosphoglycerate dehydrogenase